MAAAWLSYRDWVAEVVTRYKDDPTIAFWQLMNEAEVNPGGAFGVCPPGDAPRDELIAFATDVSGLVKSIDPDHLAQPRHDRRRPVRHVGPQYKDVHAIPDIDLCEYHDYTPTRRSPATMERPRRARPAVRRAGKPLFVGETGIRPVDVGGRLEDREAAFIVKIHAQRAHGIEASSPGTSGPAARRSTTTTSGPGDPAIRALEPLNAFEIRRS